jgi:hypothetical protein
MAGVLIYESCALFVIKYWLVARKVNLIVNNTEDHYLQIKAIVIFTGVSLFQVGLSITCLSVVYGYRFPSAYDDQLKTLKRLDYCGLIPIGVVLLLLYESLYRLKT